MTSVQDQIVFITGASSGIGASCAKYFAAAGAKLLLAARRLSRLQELASELQKEYDVQVKTVPLDVRDRTQVENTIESLPPEWRDIEILINNAGLSRGVDPLQDGNYQDWEEMIDTNVKGLLYVSRAVLTDMVARNSGHIVNIGSIAGRQPYPGGNVYCGSKAAVKSITESLKQDLLGTAIKVTCIEPGLVETEFSNVRFHGDTERAQKTYEGLTPLTPDDIADVILFSVTRPAHVNISDMLVLPVDQATATMAHRQQ